MNDRSFIEALSGPPPRLPGPRIGLADALATSPAPAGPSLADQPLGAEGVLSAVGHHGALSSDAGAAGAFGKMLSTAARGVGRVTDIMGQGQSADALGLLADATEQHAPVVGPMFERRITKAVEDFGRRATDAGDALEGKLETMKPTSALDSINALHRSLDGTEARNLHDAYDSVLATLSNHAVGSDATVGTSTAVQGIKAMDFRLADQVQQGARQRLDYLYQTMPKPPTPADLQAGWQPPDSELASWGRRIAAAERPELMLHELSQGNLVPETYETVQVLYPQFYERAKNAIAFKLTTDPASVPYAQRTLAAVMLGVPTPDTRPEAIAAAQQRMKAVMQQSMEVTKPSGAPTKKPRGTAFAPSRFDMKVGATGTRSQSATEEK